MNYPKSWTIVYATVDGQRWLARNHKGGGQTLLEKVSDEDWSDFVHAMTRVTPEQKAFYDRCEPG